MNFSLKKQIKQFHFTGTFKWLSLIIILFFRPINLHANGDDLAKGQIAFDQGHFQEAITHWKSLLDQVDTSQEVIVLTHLATAYQAIGSYENAFKMLQRAKSLAKAHGYHSHYAIILSILSRLYINLQQFDQAKTHLDEALTVARATGQPLPLAHVLNHLGNWLAKQQNYSEALKAYQESFNLAQQNGDPQLASNALINRLQTLFYNGSYREVTTALRPALQQLHNLPDIHDKAFGLISLGRLAQQVHSQTSDPELTLIAYQTFDEARQLAEKLTHLRTTSYAYGYLGQLYEEEKRYDEALRLTRRAIFLAQQADSWEILYRWYWQLGRLFKAQGDFEPAIETYRIAINYLQPIRQQLSTQHHNTSQSFQEIIEPVYFELADLLLQQANQSSNAQQRKAWLTQARNTMELFKASELQNYFQDDCVTQLQAKITSLDQLEQHTAVLYPIVLSKRLELLLSLPDGRIQQFVLSVDRSSFRETVQAFRENLTNRTHYRFVKQARQLYQWLIVPLNDALAEQQIDTLVIVPDSILRTVPLGALYDGKQFLIEKMALAVTPGLTLTDPKGLQRDQTKILLSGLSKGVQGFTPLPSVPKEINNIQSLYEQNQTLIDDIFSIEKFQKALQSTPYSIIHIASHGQFDRDPNKTFLLAYNNKLTLNRLEKLIRLSQFREEPLELLTLSACQTAVGDEQAALGLAGVAVKAGARSALATLWFIDDATTSLLVTEFYRQLQQSQSKAKALQNAQKMILAQRAFRHPAFWAAFLLIGNWL